MPTVSIGIGIAPNCSVSVGTASTWSSSDDILGNGTYPHTNNLAFQFSSVFFDPGSANGYINSIVLRMTFSIGAIDVSLSILDGFPFGSEFDGHPNPCQGDTPVSADQWSLDLTSSFLGFNISSISVIDFLLSVSTSIPTSVAGAFSITDFRIDINYDQLALASCTPNHGREGTPVTIVGSGFVNPGVTFDGIPADNIVYVDSSHITCDAPAHAPGFVDVVIDNGGVDGVKTLTNGFKYGGNIDSVFLSHGAPFGDSLVNISGSGFVDGGTITDIFFGTEPATDIFVLNDSNVSCHTPAHTLGSVFITIEFDNDPLNTIVSDTELFTYIQSSWELDNPFEPVQVGDEVTVTSDDFDLSAFVPTMGGLAVVIITQTPTSLVFVVPALAPGTYVILSGTVVLGILQVLLVGNASGIYTLVLNKTNDTIYNNARDGTTQDVKIPNPFIKTGFIGG